MDTGSNRSYVNRTQANLMGFPIIKKTSMMIASFRQPPKKYDCDVVKAELFHEVQPETSISIAFLVFPDLLPKIQSYKLNSDQNHFLKRNEIQLADPEASLDGSLEIDILLGQDCVPKLMTGAVTEIPGGSFIVPLWDGRFMLAGPVSEVRSKTENNYLSGQPNFIAFSELIEPFPFLWENPKFKLNKEHLNAVLFNITSEDELEIVESFRSLEALGIGPLDYEISPLLDDFNKTTVFTGERYEVTLPFKKPQVYQLSTNFLQAFNRLLSGHRKRKKAKFLEEAKSYQKSIDDELKLNILEKVQPIGTVDEVRKLISADPHAFDKLAVDSEGRVVHYIPHHCVYKASSGKFRRVCDAKARPAKGAFSLNDCLEKGVDLTESLLHILMKFRKFRYGCKADIEKAYPQVSIRVEDRDALRTLWLEGDTVWIYRFARLPFGLTCSPMILAATLRKHMMEHKVDETTQELFLGSLYVDDSVWSAKDFQELIDRKNFHMKIFSHASMNFREWNSNNFEARKIFGEAENRTPPLVETVLGLKWDLVSDTLSINADRVQELIGKVPRRKRDLWRLVPKLYDPIGLLSPYTMRGKRLMTKATEAVKGWDRILPQDIAEEAAAWSKEFDQLTSVQWPRHVGMHGAKSVKLAGCCDASIIALGACVYLLSTDHEGNLISHLVIAKSRLAPHPKHSIPRLELLSAVFLVNVMAHARVSYPEISDDDVWYFTDSADVLYWLYSGSYSWPVFVANQLRKLRKASNPQRWLHIDSAENPADKPSRGMSLSEIMTCSLWLHGPEFWKKGFEYGKSTLKGYDQAYNSKNIPSGCQSEIKGFKNITGFVSTKAQPCRPKWNIGKIINIDRFNDYDKLMGVTGLVLKMLYLRCNLSFPVKENLSSIYSNAEILWIQSVQLTYFGDMFTLLQMPQATVPSHIRKIAKSHLVFFDQDLGLLRCRTRNEEALHPYSTKNPILLPSSVKTSGKGWKMCAFTKMLIQKAHRDIGHAGVPQTLAHLRSEFWILQGRRQVQKILRKCVNCRKFQGKPYPTPPMPSLPDFRVRQSRCFCDVGLDFVGHVFTKEMGVEKKNKSYVVVFTCASSRAVHLEATQGQSVDHFIMAIQRFMNIRGIPENLYSDNALSFVRVSKEFESILHSKRVQRFFRQKRINWTFYTDKSPWKGGFIERLNHIFKKIFYATIGKRTLTFEEFRTMISYCMSVMNDRPLTYIYSEIDAQYKALSPSMLLTGHNLNEPPHLQLSKPKDAQEMELTQKYLFLESVKQSFWKKWQSEYLKALFERHVTQQKSQQPSKIPKVGDIVLIDGDKLPRRSWRMGKIMEVKSGRGNQIRECTVKCLSAKGINSSLIKRPPQLLIPLEVDPAESLKRVRSVVPMEGDPRKSLHASQETDQPMSSEVGVSNAAPERHQMSRAAGKGCKNLVKKRVTFEIPG